MVLSALCFTSAAQTLTVTLVPSDHNGHNISCFGSADGAIDATVTGGTPPYTYSWSNAATTEDISGLAIGYYELTVYDVDSVKGSSHVTLTEPRALSIKVSTYEYPNGFNVSCWECYNGSIDIDVTGGVPPYTYSWSDGASTEDRSGLGVSDHRVDVLDDNGCPATSETVYLDQPEIFNYIWTTLGNEAIDPDTQFIGTRDTTDLVFKTNGEERLRIKGDGQLQMEPGAEGFLGRDENGLIHVVPIEALATGMGQYFSEQMVDTFFTALSGLLSNLTLPLIGNEGTDPQRYFVGTTDTTDLVFKTNGEERLRIQADGQIKLAPGQPGFLTGNEDGLLEMMPIETIETALADYSNANTFTLLGNEGTDPEIHFIGTRDSTDLVFKSNGEERLRLKSNGDISLMGSLSGEGPLYRMADGTLGIGLLDLSELPGELCRTLGSFPYWETSGNAFSQLCPEVEPLLGTLGDMPLKVITNGEERMRILATGQVAIGATDAPETKLHVEGDLLVRGSTYGDIITRSNAEEGAALWARNNGAAWGLSIDPDGKGHILGDWNNPTPHVTFTYDRVEMPTRLVIGDIEPMEGYRLSVDEGIRTDRIVVGDVEPREGYRLMVQEGILTERVKVAVRTSNEWSDHVFLPDYPLMPLAEVECFIQENGHLPGVPSAECMVERGLDIAETSATLLAKIEELMLYTIQLEARIRELENK